VDPGGAKVLCCAFLPANSNMVIAGNARGILQLLNISTGIYPRSGSCKMGGKVLSIAWEATGTVVWAGNDKVGMRNSGRDPSQIQAYCVAGKYRKMRGFSLLGKVGGNEEVSSNLVTIMWFGLCSKGSHSVVSV